MPRLNPLGRSLYVLDITTGATFRVGIWRLIGTISGAIVGYVVSLQAFSPPSKELH